MVTVVGTEAEQPGTSIGIEFSDAGLAAGVGTILAGVEAELRRTVASADPCGRFRSCIGAPSALSASWSGCRFF